MFKIDVENINNKNESIYVFGDESILTELEKHNILINYNCRQGHCGDCILFLKEGNVTHKDCLVPLSQGEILACRARPISDIKISSKE